MRSKIQAEESCDSASLPPVPEIEWRSKMALPLTIRRLRLLRGIGVDSDLHCATTQCARGLSCVEKAAVYTRYSSGTQDVHADGLHQQNDEKRATEMPSCTNVSKKAIFLIAPICRYCHQVYLSVRLFDLPSSPCPFRLR